jgi:lysophospholipase L1-like esterase
MFPRKTALALASAILLLALARRIVPTKGLSPAIFADAARVKLFRHPPAPPTPIQPSEPAQSVPLNGIQRPQTPLAAGPLERISDFLNDDRGSLDPFYAALHDLEAPATTQPEVVTVLHYGDSPTTADLITGDVRRILQRRFGDAGSGFLLPAKPWAWYQHTGVDLSGSGWAISTAVGKNREEVYGIGGASFEGGPNASTHIALHTPASSVEISFLARVDGGTLAVSANGSALDTISTSADGAQPAYKRLALPPGTTFLDLKPSTGSVRLFGETLLSGHRGILYDSLGLNGASTSVLSNGFNASAWSAELQHERPSLVIVNYGTNESSFGPYVDKYYEGTLRTAIARIRAALPGVPILVMSPMDRGSRTGVDRIETLDTIPRIVAIQRRVADATGCAFFDTFDAMGGPGTMARWYTGQPRLVAGDLIHPTPQGASLVANLFVKDLLLGYDRYLRRQRRDPPPKREPQPAPAKIEPAPSSAKPIEPQPELPKPEAPADPVAPLSTDIPKAAPHDDTAPTPPPA